MIDLHHGVRMMIRKVMDSLTAPQEELVNDLMMEARSPRSSSVPLFTVMNQRFST